MPGRTEPNDDSTEPTTTPSKSPAPAEVPNSAGADFGTSAAAEPAATPAGTTGVGATTENMGSAALAASSDPGKSLGSGASTPSAEPGEPEAAIEAARPGESAGSGGPADPLEAPGAAEPIGVTTRARAVQPVAVPGHSPDLPGDSPAAVTGNPGSSAGPGTTAESTSDTAISGPGSRMHVQPSSAHGAPEHPNPPAVPPHRHLVAYPAGVLPAAGIVGLVAAATVPLDRPGIGWVLAASAAAAAVGAVHRRARRTAGPEHGQVRNPGRLWWAITALVLPAVGTFRAAGWLFVLCVAAAAVAGSLAVVGPRSVRGTFRDALAVPLASIGAVAWVYTALGNRSGGAGTRNRRLAVSAAVTVALLAVFVPLLAGADATFAALIDGLVPRMDSDTLTRWVVVFSAAGIGTLGALYLLAGPPLPAGGEPKIANRTLARLEWGLPVGALTVVFALFLGARLVALFGGDDYVQRTAGLTYAEYARGGFWQLAAVTVLTLAVILPVLHRAARDTAVDRLWLRGLLWAISGLTLVMIASAFGRMWTYQQAYGFTVLRLLVGTCELWLGIVYVLVIIAVLRLETAWLPRSAIATGTAALLALAALNPEGLVAAENIDRWERGEDLDVDYLTGLSVDIVPALDRLPAPIRDSLLDRLGNRLDDDTWNSWNLARSRAR